MAAPTADGDGAGLRAAGYPDADDIKANRSPAAVTAAAATAARPADLARIAANQVRGKPRPGPVTGLSPR